MTSSRVNLSVRWPKLVALRLAQEIAQRQRQRRSDFCPNAAQIAFFRAGAQARERLLRAGNQLGKTSAAAYELALHLTGDYPRHWSGYRFAAPITAWVGSETLEAARQSVQARLFGEGAEAGFLARREIPWRLRGSQGLIEAIQVRHQSGGTSWLSFKSYAQGRSRWQGATLDLLWFDEEPPEALYWEGLARITARAGRLMLTFTPRQGRTALVERFAGDDSARQLITLDLAQATHLSEARRAALLAAYEPDERAVRAHGQPRLSAGRVFPLTREAIACAPPALEPHWAQLGALDFGWDHPTAAVHLLHDRDQDRVYVVNSYRARHRTPSEHAETLRAWGEIPWVWPHDGLQHDKGSGRVIASPYREAGLRMAQEPVRFADGSISVEAGVLMMLERMRDQRLQVASHLHDWFEEFLAYRREEGRIIARHDDLMAATRYGLMGLRYAQRVDASHPRLRIVEAARATYDPLSWE